MIKQLTLFKGIVDFIKEFEPLFTKYSSTRKGCFVLGIIGSFIPFSFYYIHNEEVIKHYKKRELYYTEKIDSLQSEKLEIYKLGSKEGAEALDKALDVVKKVNNELSQEIKSRNSRKKEM